jgi:hypothetical protein
VLPYQTGTAFTDTGLSDAGRWQTEIMAPVTGNATTITENLFEKVDGQGRAAVLFPSAARTASPTVYPIYTRAAKGVIVATVVTAKTGTPSITVAIQAFDHGSGTWVSMLTSAAINTSPSTTVLTYAPGVATTANVSAPGTLPDTIRVLVTHADAQSITYSVGLDWIA